MMMIIKMRRTAEQARNVGRARDEGMEEMGEKFEHVSFMCEPFICL